MTTYDFGDGPVPARRHRNPDGSEGGWVADTATVRSTVIVGINAKVYGRAIVRGFTLLTENAIVKDSAVVEGSSWIADNAIIGGETHLIGETVGGRRKIL